MVSGSSAWTTRGMASAARSVASSAAARRAKQSGDGATSLSTKPTSGVAAARKAASRAGPGPPFARQLDHPDVGILRADQLDTAVCRGVVDEDDGGGPRRQIVDRAQRRREHGAAIEVHDADGQVLGHSALLIPRGCGCPAHHDGAVMIRRAASRRAVGFLYVRARKAAAPAQLHRASRRDLGLCPRRDGRRCAVAHPGRC